MRFSTSIAFLGLANYVNGHASIFHPSMLGFNVTGSTFPYDNRPVSPLTNYTFEQWWMHGHLAYPPHPEDVFELPAGQNVTTEIACTKSATSYFASSEGGNIQNGNDPCPGSPPSEYHTTGISDVKGCALAIAYKDDFNTTQPEDFTVFSVNQTCVWNRFTDFSVPERMPACPNGKCICAWFWIHSEDSGGEQNYMTAFQCNVTGATSDVSLATPQPPRRCGADPKSDKAMPSPGNCTYGAKQPFYWFQAERNNMFEGTYSPPFYLDLYGFVDGPQLDIFNDSYHEGKPAPSANQTALPQLKTIVQGQKLPVPNLSLLPTDFLAKVESAALSPIIFAPTSSLMPISSSAPTLTSALPSSSLEPTFSVAITPAASPLAPSNSISLSSPLLSTSSVAVASSSSLVASTVTVTNVVTVVVQVAAALPTASSSTAVSLNSTSSLDAVNATDHSRIELALPPATVLLDANSTDQVISPDPTSRSRTCKQDPHILVAQDDSKTRRSLTERLGMGTYTYRKVHKRSIWSVL